MKKKSNLVDLSEAITILTGTIIGAGILAIPYAFMKAGFLTGVFNLLILGVLTIILYLYLGEIVLRTKEKHQLTGYAGKYLGEKGKKLMAFSMIFGNYGALIAYLLGTGKSFAAMFGVQSSSLNLFGLIIGADFLFSVLFFILASYIVYLGIKGVEKSELFMTIALIFVLVLISIISLIKIDLQNLAVFIPSKIFLPFGVLLFALAGAVAIPEMKEGLENKKNLKKSIVIGSLIPVSLYLIFSLATVGVCGVETSEMATTCLGGKFGIFIILLGNIFAVFAMATSFFTLGLSLKQMYNYDYRVREKYAWMLACFIPLIIFIFISFSKINDAFFRIISITGGIAMTLEGVLIVLMFEKAKKKGNRKPEYSLRFSKIISAVLILVFVMGMIYTILEFLGLMK